MKNVNVELKSVNVKHLCGTVGLDIMDFNEGSGVYRVLIGSRGIIEEVVKTDEYVSLEELITESGESEYFEEFYFETRIDYYNGIDGFAVGIDEESAYEFFNVVI